MKRNRHDEISQQAQKRCLHLATCCATMIELLKKEGVNLPSEAAVPVLRKLSILSALLAPVGTGVKLLVLLVVCRSGGYYFT